MTILFIKKTSLAGVEPAIFRFVVWRVSIAPQALLIILLTPSFSLLPDCSHSYPFLTLSLVGSYQVGYTRSHPNTEVKMLRACSVPLCSHRWERQVIYLLFFYFSYHYQTWYHYHERYHCIHTRSPIPTYLYQMYASAVPDPYLSSFSRLYFLSPFFIKIFSYVHTLSFILRGFMV